MVESQPSKLLVAGSIPVSRSKRFESPATNGVSAERALEGREQSARAQPASGASRCGALVRTKQSMAFVQATIPVENTETFAKLKSAVESALSPANVDAYLKALSKAGLRVREFERVLQKSLLEQANGGRTGDAATLYNQLPVSDQGQMREFYLTRIEQVPSEIRTRYRKVFQYS